MSITPHTSQVDMFGYVRVIKEVSAIQVEEAVKLWLGDRCGHKAEVSLRDEGVDAARGPWVEFDLLLKSDPRIRRAFGLPAYGILRSRDLDAAEHRDREAALGVPFRLYGSPASWPCCEVPVGVEGLEVRLEAEIEEWDGFRVKVYRRIPERLFYCVSPSHRHGVACSAYCSLCEALELMELGMGGAPHDVLLAMEMVGGEDE